jgi:hypothetical protein
VRSADSPQSLFKWHRSCRGREASSFVAWSSLWSSFIGTLHCLLVALGLATTLSSYCSCMPIGRLLLSSEKFLRSTGVVQLFPGRHSLSILSNRNTLRVPA